METKAIDLGLSVKWADCNLGANEGNVQGTLMSWGVPNEDEAGIRPSSQVTHDFIDVVENELGGTWRMPTQKEFEELKNNCKWEWNEKENCYKVTGSNGNSIVLPATGYQSAKCFKNESVYEAHNGFYWSRTEEGNVPISLSFTKDGLIVGRSKYVWHTRQGIRPVLPYDK